MVATAKGLLAEFIGVGDRDADDVDDYQALSGQVTAQAVMDRQGVLDKTTTLNTSTTPDEFVQGVADVVNAILDSAGGVNDKISAFESWPPRSVPNTSARKAASKLRRR
jgi:hypothetical protein